MILCTEPLSYILWTAFLCKEVKYNFRPQNLAYIIIVQTDFIKKNCPLGLEMKLRKLPNFVLFEYMSYSIYMIWQSFLVLAPPIDM